VNWATLEKPTPAMCVFCRGTKVEFFTEDGIHADACSRCQGTGCAEVDA
jgi:hypothetical protein